MIQYCIYVILKGCSLSQLFHSITVENKMLQNTVDFVVHKYLVFLAI